MKLKMLYDLEQMPSTAFLSSYIEAYGYSSYGPILDNDEDIIGNLWFDPNDLTRTDFTELQSLLSSQYEFASYEVVE